MTPKFNRYLLSLVILIISVGLLSGCTKTLDVASSIEGEWTYTNGLAEIEFDKDGNAAVITPSGSSTETNQYTYKLDGNQITLTSKETDEIVLEAQIEITEEDGKEYLTISNLHDKDGNTINPTKATFEKLGDSTSAIE